ncbi:MAG: antibiotic biosynthesis monooxygenase family protein [Planctomycetota bacterium]
MNSYTPPTLGFAVIYRWRLHRAREEAFIEAWAQVTHAIRDQCGGLGSRLHRGDDGVWLAYAQWPSRAMWDDASLTDPALQRARKQMREAIAETLPDIPLSPVADLLVPVTTPASYD